MYSFKNDYSEGAHPNILNALAKNNLHQEDGYGEDQHCKNAIAALRKEVGDEQADIHLLSGGTQTNLIAISSFLRPHEACITAATGHIATHETGAIEATGHKLLEIDSTSGRLTPEMIEPVLIEHHFEHMVKPRLVYISNPTELGTVYTKGELQALHDFCDENKLLLYMDGARLGAAVTCAHADADMMDMYQLTDALFVGATKNGALLGEALITRNPQLRHDLRYMIKQRGGLLAKGRILGIQFEELFSDSLYFDLARGTNERAQYMAAELKKSGCPFYVDSPTNQIFPVMANTTIEVLAQKYAFYVWANVDEQRSAIRLVTSWATTKEAVRAFLADYNDAKVV